MLVMGESCQFVRWQHLVGPQRSVILILMHAALGRVTSGVLLLDNTLSHAGSQLSLSHAGSQLSLPG